MEVTTVAIDLAKNVFALCGADENGRVVLREELRRAQAAGLHAPTRPVRGKVWRPRAGRIAGRANSLHLGMRYV